MAAPTWFGRAPLHAAVISRCVLPVAKARTRSFKFDAPRLVRAGIAVVARRRPSLPVSDDYGTIVLEAEQRKERVLQFLGDQLHGLTQRNPVLLIFEDAHWLDPATREFIDHLLPRIGDVPVLMVQETHGYHALAIFAERRRQESSFCPTPPCCRRRRRTRLDGERKIYERDAQRLSHPISFLPELRHHPLLGRGPQPSGLRDRSGCVRHIGISAV
jgi:hypothetical protein